MRCCRRDGIKAVLGTQEGGAGTLGFSLAVPGEPGRAGSGRFREVGFHAKDPKNPTLGVAEVVLSPGGPPLHGPRGGPSPRVDPGTALPLPRLGFVLKPRVGKAGPLARPVGPRGKRDERGAGDWWGEASG